MRKYPLWIAGRWQDRSLARQVKLSFRGATSVPVVSYSGPVEIGADLSDQREAGEQANFVPLVIAKTAHQRAI